MSEPKPSKRHNFYLPDDTYAAMKKAADRLAKARGTTVSVCAWLREAIDRALRTSK